MLKAICDRCKEEIPDYEAEKSQISILNGSGHFIEIFDLCELCLPIVSDSISDFVRGEKTDN